MGSKGEGEQSPRLAADCDTVHRPHSGTNHFLAQCCPPLPLRGRHPPKQAALQPNGFPPSLSTRPKVGPASHIPIPMFSGAVSDPTSFPEDLQEFGFPDSEPQPYTFVPL